LQSRLTSQTDEDSLLTVYTAHTSFATHITRVTRTVHELYAAINTHSTIAADASPPSTALNIHADAVALFDVRVDDSAGGMLHVAGCSVSSAPNTVFTGDIALMADGQVRVHSDPAHQHTFDTRAFDLQFVADTLFVLDAQQTLHRIDTTQVFVGRSYM
jgi:hypothetical protein